MKCPTFSHYRWLVTLRVLAAALGGYALTTSISILLALLLPLPKIQALQAAMLLSFILYTVAVIWAFSARSVTCAWLGMLIPTLLAALAYWPIQYWTAL